MDEPTKTKLERLNFSGILKYESPVRRGFRGVGGAPLNTCAGFCHDCEDWGFAPRNGSSGILMSHGCTTDDYIKVIGQSLPEVKCDLPIMFLLENPGGDYGNGESRETDGVTKNPPINHFYFSPSIHSWPTVVSGNHYGDYFAYLMAKFGLSNVYITNCIKCKYGKDHYAKTANNCMARFLKHEIEIFHPKLIVCFSQKVSNELFYKHIECSNEGCDATKVCLIHPSADSRPRWRGNWTGIVKENDKRLDKALRNLVANELLRVDVTNELCTLSGEQWSVSGWCSIDCHCENSGVRFSPQSVVKQLPDGIELYCVFNKTGFRGCEIAAWHKDAKREIFLNASSEEEKLKWHFSRCGNWIAWRGFRGDSVDDSCKGEYGMTWNSEFFERIQGEPEYKKQIVKELAGSVLKLYELLTT